MVNISTSVLRTYREQNVHIQKKTNDEYHLRYSNTIEPPMTRMYYVQVFVMML
jgi:hypothetical protein